MTKIPNYSRGFTLIELVVVITIIALLSGIVLASIGQYTNKGKDSNIYGNLAVLIPAGEVYYNGNGYSYKGFCDPTEDTGNSAMRNTISQMPVNISGVCYNSSTTATANPAGLCCYVKSDYQAWAACVLKFTDSNIAYCVDSRGMKKEINRDNCAGISETYKCP